jgi:GTP-binding protein
MWVWLRLKLLADCGLVGLPNAGKSTFINAVSNAKAKVGDYPFTTVRPQLGVASHKGQEFVVADIPGLIEGAADGAGIGDRFLGHIERCRVLLHLIDATESDPVDAYEIVCGELENYGEGLSEKPQIVALNKVDAIDAKMVEKLRKKIAKASGAEVMLLSGATGDGLEPVLDKIIEALGPVAEAAKASEDAEPWSPI